MEQGMMFLRFFFFCQIFFLNSINLNDMSTLIRHVMIYQTADWELETRTGGWIGGGGVGRSLSYYQ